MSERAPYSRVYWTVRNDDRLTGIYSDDHHWATWNRLLLAADMAWPAPADLPANARRASLRALEAAGVIELLPGGLFCFHGLDTERGRRREAASASRSGPVRHPDGTQTGPRRDPDASLASRVSRAEPSRDEPSLANGRADALDTYWTLMGTYPNGRTKAWIEELVNEFGDGSTSAAIAAESSGDRQGLLGRTRDRLRHDVDKAAKAEAVAETKRLEADAVAKKITPEQAAETARRVQEELRKMVGPLNPGRVAS